MGSAAPAAYRRRGLKTHGGTIDVTIRVATR
jgi:hypothetical protein